MPRSGWELFVFDGWIDELNRVPVATMALRDLCDLARAAARLRSALDSLDVQVAAAIDRLDDGGAGAAATLRSATRLSQRSADRIARRAEGLRSLPSVDDALAAGAVTAEHVDALVRAAAHTSPEAVEESDLLATAMARPADLLAKDIAAFTRRHRADDDLEARQARLVAERSAAVFTSEESGMTVLHAEFDPITGEKLRLAIDERYRSLDRADGGRGNGERTPQQRRADAVAELILGSHTSTRAENRRPPARSQLIVVAHADGSAEIPGVGPIPASELSKLVCESELFELVFGQDGQPLWLGNGVRLATDDQFRALVVRDGGCAVCDARPSRCEVHHLVWVEHGGPTDIDNLVLLCSHHHHLIHDRGWSLRLDALGRWTLDPP